MQEVLVLVATAILAVSMFKTATLNDPATAHFTEALAAQGVTGEAEATARTLLLDALGPAGSGGVRGYKCMVFEVSVGPPGAAECRRFRLEVSGSAEAAIDGTLCPQADGNWGEASGQSVSSVTLDQRWRDVTLKSGASLYSEPQIKYYQGKFDWPDTTVQVGGYRYRDAQSFALIRLPNGDTHYVSSDQIVSVSAKARP